MSDTGFVTKGSEQYFAEREQKIQAHIDDAKSKIAEIENRMRAEIEEIKNKREMLRKHLSGFIDARNDLVRHRAKTIQLIVELENTVKVVDDQLPTLDEMLTVLEKDYRREDYALDEAEGSRTKQLKKYERKKARYEGRQVRLELRKNIFLRDSKKTEVES